jgi:glutamyl-tRNA reductase
VFFSELDRTLGARLKHLGEADRAALKQMLESAVGKLLHTPTAKLKARAADSEDAHELAAAVRYLFDLEEAAPVREPPAAAGEAPSSEDDERLPN